MPALRPRPLPTVEPTRLHVPRARAIRGNRPDGRRLLRQLPGLVRSRPDRSAAPRRLDLPRDGSRGFRACRSSRRTATTASPPAMTTSSTSRRRGRCCRPCACDSTTGSSGRGERHVLLADRPHRPRLARSAADARAVCRLAQRAIFGAANDRRELSHEGVRHRRRRLHRIDARGTAGARRRRRHRRGLLHRLLSSRP